MLGGGTELLKVASVGLHLRVGLYLGEDDLNYSKAP